MTGFVYKWTNTINNKWYIGSHKGTIDDGYRHSSKSLLAAEKKYGIDSFTREIIFEGDYEKDNMKAVEAKFLNEGDAAANPMSYNQSNMTGPSCHSEESNRKRSNALKGRKLSAATRKKMSISGKGKNKGRILGPWSEESNRKRSKTLTGRTISDETRQRRMGNTNAHKPIIHNGICYESRNAAAAALGVNKSTISKWLKEEKLRAVQTITQ